MIITLEQTLKLFSCNRLFRDALIYTGSHEVFYIESTGMLYLTQETIFSK